MKLNFGDYVQLHLPADNTQAARSIGCIVLYPSEYAQGGWHFMSLLTGRVMHGRTWTEMPIGQDVLAAVERLRIKDKQPLIGENFLFEWSAGDEMSLEDDQQESDDQENDQ
jgi:hypothetical protein